MENVQFFSGQRETCKRLFLAVELRDNNVPWSALGKSSIHLTKEDLSRVKDSRQLKTGGQTGFAYRGGRGGQRGGFRGGMRGLPYKRHSFDGATGGFAERLLQQMAGSMAGSIGSRGKGKAGPGAAAPGNINCYKCEQPGHLWKNCPVP